MLKTDARYRVVELNIDAEVVTVELELVARAQSGGFVNVNRQCGNGAIKGQSNVFVLGRVRLVFYAGRG